MQMIIWYKHLKIRFYSALSACFAGLLFVGFLTVQPAPAEEKPHLQLDTGGHMALIRKIIFTADGTKLISASDDKTIRIWDIKSGNTIRILRGEIDTGEAGKIYAIALSPDGRLLAAAGHTEVKQGAGHPIRLYDLATGRILALLKGHSGAVLSLDFSSDGTKLASGGTDDTAIIWDIERRAAHLQLKGHVGDVNVVRFSSNQRLVTGGDDKTVRLWRVGDGRRVGPLRKHGDVVRDIAISRRANMIASGSVDGIIKLWDLRNGRPITSFGDRRFEVTSLSFGPDGQSLLQGSGASPYHSFVWNIKARKKSLIYKAHDNIVLASAISPNGRLAATGGGNNNEIHIWNIRSGKHLKGLRGAGQAVWSVGFSTDNRKIAWGNISRFEKPNDLGPLAFSLRLPVAGRTTGEPRKLSKQNQRFVRAISRIEGFNLTHRSAGKFGYYDTIDLNQGQRRCASLRRGEQDGYAHNSYSFLPGRRAVITGGGHGFLSVYGFNGQKTGEYAGHTGDIWAIAVSPDGTRLISGSDDQTLRLWNVATGENIISLFHGRNGAWVMWTPQGYFAASPDGDRHVGWHINQGQGKAARFVTAAQLKKHFYRPDIIKRALELNSALAAIAQAPNTEFSLQDLLLRTPPSFGLSSPQSRKASLDGLARINVIADENRDPIDGWDLIVNGRNVNVEKPKLQSRRLTFTVALKRGLNRIKVTARNAVGRTAHEVILIHDGAISAVQRGTLYMVAIGVDKYANFAQDLNFAGRDAEAFHKTMIERAGKLHSKIVSRVLTKNSALKPTAENIRKALEIFRNARPEDTVVLFLAGHGVNDGPNYLFLPGDAKFENKAWNPPSVINWQLLQKTLQNVQGRRMMVVDTCHAGNAFNARLVKDADDASIVVFAATDAETLAQERPELGHGVFTHTMLRGLAGEADRIPDRFINIRELKDFITTRVKSITKGAQEPTVQLPNKQNFVLTRF